MISALICIGTFSLFTAACQIFATMGGKAAISRAVSIYLGLVSGLTFGALWGLGGGKLASASLVLGAAAGIPLAAGSVKVALGLAKLRSLGLPPPSDPSWREADGGDLLWAGIKIKDGVLSVGASPIACGLAVALLGRRVRRAVAGRRLVEARAEIAAARAGDADRRLRAAEREDLS